MASSEDKKVTLSQRFTKSSFRRTPRREAAVLEISDIKPLKKKSSLEPTGYVAEVDEDLRVQVSEFNAKDFVAERCAVLGEKALRDYHRELKSHSKHSLQEMKTSVRANYKAFINYSSDVTKLENHLHKMRQNLALHATLVKSLIELSYDGIPATEADESDAENDIWEEDNELSAADSLAAQIPDQFEYLMAERRMHSAIDVLEEGEQLVTKSVYGEGEPSEWLSKDVMLKLHGQLIACRERIEGQLKEDAKQPNVRSDELLVAIGGLHRLGNGQLAHTLLLSAHESRLRIQVRELKKSGIPFSATYTAGISQLVFSGILQAAVDSASIWADSPQQSSELMLWAQTETVWFADQLKHTILSAAGAIGGLRLASECVTIAMAHCALLEEHGVSLVPSLAKLIKPVIEEAVESHVFRIWENVEASVELDPWVLYPINGEYEEDFGQSSDSSNVHLTNSAIMLFALLQEFVEDICPIIMPLQLMGPVLLKISNLFGDYVKLLVKALPESEDSEDGDDSSSVAAVIVNKATEEVQQLALMGNAASFADILLPRMAAKLASPPDLLFENGDNEALRLQSDIEILRYVRNHNEQREWYRGLQASVDKLRDILCSCFVADFMYGDDGRPLLTIDEYLKLDAVVSPEQWRQSPFPSQPFQAMFAALTSMATSASEVLPQREKVVTLLLMRLAEWLLMALMVYSKFWEEMELSEWGLGPTGLQQLVLDMYFVMQIAANGKFSSRALRKVALDSMARAITLYKEQSGDDPNRVLNDDTWFQAHCDEAMDVLLARNPEFRFHMGPSSITSEDLYS